MGVRPRHDQTEGWLDLLLRASQRALGMFPKAVSPRTAKAGPF